MIDLGTDVLIRLTDVPKLSNLPRRRGGKRLNKSTVFRWAMRSGNRLETVRVGGALCTTITALNEFFHVLAGNGEPTGSIRTPKRRERDTAAAEAELAAVGI